MNLSKDISDFEQILDDCLARLEAGESMAQCLGDYPDQEKELRPLLQMAVVVQAAQLPVARPLAVEQGQAGMLAALTGREKRGAVSFGSLGRYAERIRSVLKQEEASQMRLALRSIVTTFLLLFVSGFFALTISANSLPGEPFYPVKRGWESARLGLTFDADARQALKAQIQQNRQDELAALLELGRQSRITYEGVVAQIEEGQLVVDAFLFLTSRETVWRSRPEVGEAVRIETEITADGQLLALEISAGSLDFRPSILPTATPCNTPACVPPTATSTPCNAGACGGSTPTPVATKTPNGPTPTPCNSPACVTPTPCNAGVCGTSTSTPIPTNTPGNNPTPTPCNSPACAPPTATPTPCNTGACNGPTPTPIPTNTPGNNPTPTPCNTGACNGPTPTPIPTNTPGNNPTPTPCNSPACAPPTATPTPCNTGACNAPTPTPIPTNTPGNNPTPTPCNSPSCATSTPVATPTQCNAGACGGPTPTPPNSPPPSPTLCNTVGCN